jgi:hypothetical protein
VTPPEIKSIANELANEDVTNGAANVAKAVKNDLPVAAVVGDVAGDIDPIGPLIQKINPENITALSNGASKILLDAGTATSVIMDATGRLINSSGEVIGSLVKGTTEIINNAGKVVTNISDEALKRFEKLGVKAIGVVGKSVDTLIKESSETARIAVKEFGETARTGIRNAANVIQDAMDKGANVINTGITSLKERTIANDRNKMIKWIVGAVLVVIIIITVIVFATRPKKMTNNMSTPLVFDQNYNPEAQSHFTEKEYKYYNELVI